MTEGSHAGFVSLLRDGAVLVLLHPYRGRNPEAKNIAFYAGVRTIEYLQLDPIPEYNVGDPRDAATRSDVHSFDSLSLRDCDRYAYCTFWWRSITRIAIPISMLIIDLRFATRIYGSPPDAACEQPLAWPIESENMTDKTRSDLKHEAVLASGSRARAYREFNWRVCEPSMELLEKVAVDSEWSHLPWCFLDEQCDLAYYTSCILNNKAEVRVTDENDARLPIEMCTLDF
jgi:hypothetical protein